MTQSSHQQGGVIALVASAVIWGCFPLYWSLLNFTNALDILGNRIIWSLLFGVILLRIIDGHFLPKAINGKQIILLGLASILLSFNWGISIYAVEINRVVEGGIGMYFAPVFQIILGCILFRESITRTKILVSVILLISIGLLIYDLGEFPFIAFAMGMSFACYASVKKLITISSRQSFIYETFFMVIPAITMMSLFGSALTSNGWEKPLEPLLLIGAGLIAAPPLILYGFGAQRTTLATSGMILNFIPIINILIGIFILNERFSEPVALSTLLISIAVFYYTLAARKRAA